MARRVKIQNDNWNFKKRFQFKNGDCFELMKLIPDGSVDLILTDPPYGISTCEWDFELNLEKMWDEFNRILTPIGSAVVFSSQRFTVELINSNLTDFKYFMIWLKSGRGMSFVHAKNYPILSHEEISVFSFGKIKHQSQNSLSKVKGSESSNTRMVYNPVGTDFTIGYERRRRNIEKGHQVACPSHGQGAYIQGSGYPKSFIFSKSVNKPQHPTQKPVKLLRYLVAMFSNPGQIVLDPFAGVATTVVAAISLNRIGWGVELDKEYFKKGSNRIVNYTRNKVLE